METNIIAILLLFVAPAYLLLSANLRKPIAVGNWRFNLPAPTNQYKQLTLSICELILGASTLYIILNSLMEIHYLYSLALYLIALGAGVISNVPGGIGVFESIFSLALPQVDHHALLSAIII